MTSGFFLLDIQDLWGNIDDKEGLKGLNLHIHPVIPFSVFG
jgi:hypothetical protein